MIAKKIIIEIMSKDSGNKCGYNAILIIHK